MTYRLRQRNNYTVTSLPFGLRGAFIPPFGTFVDADHDNTQVREHEDGHYAQWKTMGTPLFYLAYLYEYLVYGYNDMPMEKECRTNETPFCQQNYTTCYPKSF